MVVQLSASVKGGKVKGTRYPYQSLKIFYAISNTSFSTIALMPRDTHH